MYKECEKLDADSTFDIHRPAGKLKTDIRAYSEKTEKSFDVGIFIQVPGEFQLF